MASLRERARRGERLIGGLLRMPAEELVEMSAVAGMDFVLIDCEHGPADILALRQHLAVAALHDVPVIVRVGEDDAGQILRVLDQGAEGILAPHIDSAADAERLVSASLYPPAGTRGFATYSRAGRFGRTPPEEHRRRFLENTLVLGMIESPAAVAAVEEIVRTARLDGIMIGPADLAAASGPEDPPVAESTAAVNEVLRRAGLLRMDIVGNVEAARRSFDDGAQLVVYNLASSLMAHLEGLVGGRP
ncbi:MAG: aldolase/citrate lyase family protein [Microbacterium sp.]